MKHVIWKVFVNYEKEEKWLNEMSAKGMAMTGYTWCRYVFENSPENEYTYRIELLSNPPSHAESAAYIRFLEDSGIECVDSYLRWIYLRRKSAEGEFDIYSDLESRLMHYKRITSLWATLMWIEFLVGAINISIGPTQMISSDYAGSFPYVNLILGIFLILIGLMFFRLIRSLNRKINQLKKEREIRE